MQTDPHLSNQSQKSEEKALAVGIAEKAKEFVEKGSEIYYGIHND